MRVIKGRTMPKALRIVIYGIHGSAKTTLASKLRNALFLDYENGTHGIDCDKADPSELPRDYAKFKGMLAEFRKDHQGYETLIIDTGDALENALDHSYSAEKGIESVFSVNDYGRTVNDHNAQIGSILDKVNDLVESGMNVVWICHEQKRKIEPLEGPKIPNDHSELKLSKGASKLLMQSVDWAIFCARKTFHVEGDKKSGEKAHLEGGKLWTFHSPSNDWDAKHRACIEVADDCSMDRLQETFQQIVDAATGGAKAEAKAEAPKPEPREAEPKEGSESARNTPIAALLRLVSQYGVDEVKLRRYMAGKMNDRYGLDFVTLAMDEWPDEAVLWLCRLFDKIVEKYDIKK